MNKKTFIFVLAIILVVLVGGIMAYVFERDYIQSYDLIEDYVYIGPAQPVTVKLPINLAENESADK